MNLRREHIIGIAVFVLLLACVGGGYQFYYKKQLAIYEEYLGQLETLEKTLKHLEDTFSGYQPKVLIEAVKGDIQPMADEVMRRAAFFNVGDWMEIDPIPEGKMLRFYYEEQYGKALNALRQYAQSKSPPCPIPDDISFGAQKPEDFAGKSITKADVERNLRIIRFGSMVVRMLIDAKAVIVNKVEIHPGRQGLEKLLNLRTVGLSYVMNLKDLVIFIDALRMKDRYFNIEAISIQNRYMRWPVEPPVEVQMLLTVAAFNPAAAAVSGGLDSVGVVGPAARPGMPARDALAQQNIRGGAAQKEPMSTRVIRWLRNHYLWPF
ncbi:MAG TPA: hypothetical protein P5318_18865 [Candidatus Hydrogenedentes bacterium]|nr:hypothetical protein [Candidatus Hydrogenedentota bacterium]HPC18541.1 hypothetical protein [Candidatus Hydrogenedentota bacterium]HRT22176.1 hypothetical protein [Candidatus Hydrogenedentota bacterium]HRT66952.1 hypothetical protein [Candidatus Hydrogenedentota bacterium]